MSQGDRDESIPPTQILSLNDPTPPTPTTDDESFENPLQRQNAFRFLGRAPTAPAGPVGRREEHRERDLLRKSR